MDKLKVLLVDDMMTARNFVKYGVENNHKNIEIEEASNGKEAQARLEGRQYDLILCDWEMPVMTGEDLLKWVKGHATLNKIKFIMITAKSEKENVLKAMQLGVDGYLVKPFTIEALLHKMASVDRRFDRRQYERVETSGVVTLHFREQATQGELLDISLGGFLATFPRNGALPQILEKVSVDVKTSENSTVEGIDGFIIRIQAADAHHDSQLIKIAAKYLDLEAEKLKSVQGLINSISKSSA